MIGASQTALTVLNSCQWPGNVRELENVIRRAVILAESDTRDMIQQHDLPENTLDKATTDKPFLSLEDQILHLLKRFEFSHDSIRLTAKALGNRYRGTITEYFKGICFQLYVESNYDIEKTVETIAGTHSDKVLIQVKKKAEIIFKEHP